MSNDTILERPKSVTDEHLEYLDDLRESGVTNMWGAGIYLRDVFLMSEKEATEVLLYWMETFTQRHQSDTKNANEKPA